MKPGLKKVSGLLLMAAAAVCFIFALLHIKAVIFFAGKAAAFILNKFEIIVRDKIGYFAAYFIFLVLVGMALKRIWGVYDLQPRYRSLVDGVKKAADKYKNYKAITPIVYSLLTGMSILLFFIAPFPYAFAYAAGLTIYFVLKFRDDRKKLYILSVIIILLFYAPNFFMGENIHVKIFDTLDANVPQIKVLAESGKAFSLDMDTKIDNFINGLPLNGIYSGYSVVTWSYMIFDPITAYTFNVLMMAFAGFIGMVLLLKRHVFRDGGSDWIITGSALCFSLLPFYYPGGLSFAGFPLLLYAFMNIRNSEGRVWDFLIVLVYPFYSRLALAGVFVLFVLGMVLVIDLLRERRLNLPFLGASALLTFAYGFVNLHRVYSFINPDFVSHRSEIVPSGMSTLECLKLSINSFIFDTTHSAGAQQVFVMIAAALAVAFAFRKKTEKIKVLVLFILLALVNAFLWGFKYWGGSKLVTGVFRSLNAFNFSRFYFFNPIIWHLIFALALWIIYKKKWGKPVVSLLIVFQLLFLFTSYNQDYRHLLGQKTKLKYTLSYKEFYSEALFKEIGTFINKPKKDYRVVSIGMHPGIAQYNGFYTLDVYANIYPLEYKHRFERIIEKELEKSPALKRGFDNNAKRCYVLVSELHGKQSIRSLAFTRGITKKESPRLKIRNLELNTAALKEMGGEYIFSAVEIVNYAENGLAFEKVFKRKDSPWKIFLYRVL